MIEELNECIVLGLKFPEFKQLYDKIVDHVTTIVKIHYFLSIHERFLEDDQNIFCTKKETDDLLDIFYPRAAKKPLKTRKNVE